VEGDPESVLETVAQREIETPTTLAIQRIAAISRRRRSDEVVVAVVVSDTSREPAFLVIEHEIVRVTRRTRKGERVAIRIGELGVGVGVVHRSAETAEKTRQEGERRLHIELKAVDRCGASVAERAHDV